MAATIYDVAAKAGVSFQLASAVLGRKKYARASEATRNRIFEAASQLDYRSNTAAAVLAGGRSGVIGVIVDSHAPESMYRLLAEIEQSADRAGYRILTAQAHDNPGKLLAAYRSLKQHSVDGIISFSHDYAQMNRHLDDELKNDPKIVFVLNTPDVPCSSADVDIIGGMKAAVDHLRTSGYRKTALVLKSGSRYEEQPQSCKLRLDGFRQACPRGRVVGLDFTLFDAAVWKRKLRDLVRNVLIPGKFDSAIVENDMIAAVLMKEILAAGIRIPADFGLIGWDDLALCECLPVELTSVHYDTRKLGEAVLKILLDKIDGKLEPVRIFVPLELVPRESTDKKGRR